MSLSRRTLLQAGGCSLFLNTPAWSSPARMSAASPHFFLEIFISGGWDVSYLFDARPLAMTAAGKIQNYSGKEPELWTDREGRQTWLGTAAQNLKKHFDAFSVLNGVHMASGFDGHDQNALYALTGNPFGGDTNLAQLGGSQTPLDFLQQGSVFGSSSIRNKGKSISLSPQSALALSSSLREASTMRSLGSLIDPYVAARLEANGASRPSSGLFADGSFKMREALKGTSDIEARLRQIKLDFAEKSPIQQNLLVACEYFRAGLTRTGVIFLNPGIDAHDRNTAKNLPGTLTTLVNQLAEAFDFLKQCPAVSSEQQSLLDETTILISSEFSRTMRQSGVPLEETGTDHNPLNNSVLIGGKGIKPGLIVGGSDFRDAEETLSGAHIERDPKGLSIMGLPFDRATLGPLAAYKPEGFPRYRQEDYLNFAAVANTLFELFAADPTLHWTNDRNGPAVPALQKLLS